MSGTRFVAECFWPGVEEGDVAALGRRIDAAAAGSTVRYLGAILMHEDEVVLCEFEGRAEAVRAIAEEAAVPFARLLEASRSGGC